MPQLQRSLTEFKSTLGTAAEVIVVDDGSSDQTLPLLLKWAADDPNVKIVVLARNFGHQNASIAGLNASKGDAVVLMDADLQDPLEPIREMIARYEQGYDVIYGKRLSREGESPFKLFTAWLFYRLMKAFVHPNLPPDAGDFRLISRRCLDSVCAMGEVHLFLRGMISWVGFLQTSVSYHRQARLAGATKYTFWKMLRFALNAVFSFTILPLRISLIAGLIIALLGMAYGLYAACQTLLYHDTVQGWTTQIIFTTVLGGALLMSNGILGEYVGRSFEQVKGRPLYIVAHRVNFEEK